MDRSMLSRVLGPVVALLLGLTIATAGVGFAASLGLIAARLTAFEKASTIPVTTCTLTASADTYAEEQPPNPNNNFGTAANLDVKARIQGGNQRRKRTFVRFDIGSCSIPANAAVQSASMGLVMLTAPATNRTYNLQRVTAAWTESGAGPPVGLTWNNQPGVAGVTATAATGTASTTLTFNVLGDVATFVSGTNPNNGWRLADSVEDPATDQESSFRSREFGTAASRPSLVITYYP
jgi:hypothetical protein